MILDYPLAYLLNFRHSLRQRRLFQKLKKNGLTATQRQRTAAGLRLNLIGFLTEADMTDDGHLVGELQVDWSDYTCQWKTHTKVHNLRALVLDALVTGLSGTPCDSETGELLMNQFLMKFRDGKLPLPGFTQKDETTFLVRT